MILYSVLIAIAVLVLSLVVWLVTSANFFMILGLSVLAVVIAIAINGLTAAICRWLPKKVAHPDNKIYRVSAKEKKFYEKLKIRKWKDKVPEIGHFTGFRKNKIADPKSVEYLERFLMEIGYGELGHFVSCFTSFLLILFFPLFPHWFAISVPVSIIAMLFNIPSFMILRYTSYKLQILRGSLLKKQQREPKTEEKIA